MTSGFGGGVADAYDRHLVPVLFDPYAREVARRVPSGVGRALEIAAGTGGVTRRLVAALPAGATLVATDLDPGMLAVGRRQVADPRVRWETADAQALPFDAAGFDLVVCQFGLMFFPEAPRALAEMHRVLAPGGTLLLATWDAIERNAAQCMVHEMAVAQFPGDPPRFLELPFSMHDGAALEALARGAGFGEARVETVPQIADAPAAADFAVGLVRGTPLWHQLAARGVDGEAFEAAVCARLVREFGDRPCRSPLSAHVLTARR